MLTRARSIDLRGWYRVIRFAFQTCESVPHVPSCASKMLPFQQLVMFRIILAFAEFFARTCSPDFVLFSGVRVGLGLAVDVVLGFGKLVVWKELGERGPLRLHSHWVRMQPIYCIHSGDCDHWWAYYARNYTNRWPIELLNIDTKLWF